VTQTLSVVIPVYNEAAHLELTVERLLDSLVGSGFDANVVVVDDGSTDGSGDVAGAALAGVLPFRVVRQSNRGRFHAVRTGIREADAEFLLVLGSRVRLRPGSLAFVRERIAEGELVWTGHVHIHAEGNPYGTFMNVLTEIAWGDYFDAPRTASFGVREFDRFPKGSGCFVAPRELLLAAFSALPTRYADVRHANDDAPMLRQIARTTDIHISPSFAADYVPRGTFRTFIKHSVHRGAVFFDGHGRRESRFFPYIAAFYPASAAFAIAVVSRPRLLPTFMGMTSIGAGTVATRHRRSGDEVATVVALSPVWALALGAGLWRGLGMFVRQQLRRADPNPRSVWT
jgi:glycosyltransferase involved in cell wall biosynthesis